jgi:hypothetical protein
MKSEIVVGEAPARPGLPLFYKVPHVLEPRRHAGAGLTEGMRLGFAATTNSVPLAADEFFPAQAHYPIVFTATAPVAPMALVGVGPDRNLFVDRDGAWRQGGYVPAYVRRYPFVFVRAGDGQFALAVDEAAENFSAGGGRPLFADGKPSDLAKQALQFCAAFQQQFERAQAFSAALEEQGLLADYRAELRVPGGKPVTLAGFRVIDEAKFNALPDEVFLDWRRKGYGALVHAHLMSMHRWSALAALAGGGRSHG